MAFKTIKEYISTEDGTPGTLLIPKLILPALIDEVEKNLVPRELAKVVYTPNMIQGSSITVDLETADSLTLKQLGEGAEIPLDNMTYSSITFTPVKYGVAIRITREMTEDSQFPLLEGSIRASGRRFAENETKLILTALDGSSNDVSGGAAVTIANITEAMKNIEDNNFTATDILCGNEFVQDLRNIDTFVEADKRGNSEMLDRGFVGRVYGLNAVRFSPSTNVTPSTSHTKYGYVLDRTQAYGIAISRDITLENFDLPTYDMSGAAITQRIDVKLLRAGAVSRITTA